MIIGFSLLSCSTSPKQVTGENVDRDSRFLSSRGIWLGSLRAINSRSDENSEKLKPIKILVSTCEGKPEFWFYRNNVFSKPYEPTLVSSVLGNHVFRAVVHDQGWVETHVWSVVELDQDSLSTQFSRQVSNVELPRYAEERSFNFVREGVLNYIGDRCDHFSSDMVLSLLTLQELSIIEKYFSKLLGGDMEEVKEEIENGLFGDPTSLSFFADAYSELKNQQVAFKWKKLAANTGGVYHQVRYADWLWTDEGSLKHLADATEIFFSKLDEGYGYALDLFTFDLPYPGIYLGLDTEALHLHWLEFYADKGLDPEPLYIKGVESSSDLYNYIGANYMPADADIKYSYPRTELQKKHTQLANYYFAKANNKKNTEQIALFEGDIEGKISRSRKNLDTFCRDVVPNIKKDVALRDRYQRMVFADPENRNQHAKDFHKEVEKRYQGPIILNFKNTPLRSILTLAFDFSLKGGNYIAADLESLSNVRNHVYANELPFPFSVNILLYENNIDVVCDDSSVKFVFDSDNHQPKFVSPNLIMKWSDSLLANGNEINGNGYIEYEGDYKMEGYFVNGLLSGGRGRVLESSEGNQYVSIFESSDFKNGMAQGKGFIKQEGEDLYVGGFENNLYSGQGEIGTFHEHYVGEFERGLYSGKGYIRYVKRPKGSLLTYFFPIEHDFPLLYSYEGKFVKGNKHGVGVCSDAVNNNYPCEFHYDQLIGLNNISMLPKGASLEKHFDIVK